MTGAGLFDRIEIAAQQSQGRLVRDAARPSSADGLGRKHPQESKSSARGAKTKVEKASILAGDGTWKVDRRTSSSFLGVSTRRQVYKT